MTLQYYIMFTLYYLLNLFDWFNIHKTNFVSQLIAHLNLFYVLFIYLCIVHVSILLIELLTYLYHFQFIY